MKLTVIIVNYNVRYFLEQCLRSLFLSGAGIDMEVYVVDNASSDRSVPFLRARFPKKQYPRLHFIVNAENMGFGYANNQALKKAAGEYVLYLNPDTLLTEHTLHDVLAFADSQPLLGALGVKMLQENGRFAFESRRGLPTPWTSFCRMAGLATLFPKSRRFGRYYMRYLDENEAAEIEIVSGAFMLGRREVLQQLGGFDEDFFMYGEDIDLSYRLLKSGRKNYYVPTPIVHYKGESTQKNSYRYVHVFYEAMLIFFRKHFRHYSLLFSLPINIAIVLRAAVALIAMQLKALRSIYHPHEKKVAGSFLYYGRNMEQMKHLAEQWRLDVTYVEADEQALPDGHLTYEGDLAPFMFVIYDDESYSLSKILENAAHSPQPLYVATYHAQSNVLITGGKVYHAIREAL